MDPVNRRQHNTTLRKLDLRHNPCGDVGSCLGNALAKLGWQFPMWANMGKVWGFLFWGRKKTLQNTCKWKWMSWFYNWKDLKHVHVITINYSKGIGDYFYLWCLCLLHIVSYYELNFDKCIYTYNLLYRSICVCSRLQERYHLPFKICFVRSLYTCFFLNSYLYIKHTHFT